MKQYSAIPHAYVTPKAQIRDKARQQYWSVNLSWKTRVETAEPVKLWCLVYDATLHHSHAAAKWVYKDSRGQDLRTELKDLV